MTRAVYVTACKCECLTHLKRLEKDRQYGKALTKAVDVLSDPADPWSCYPFFQRTSFVETGPLSWTAWILLVIISLACGIAPHMWTVIQHDESLSPTTGDDTMRDVETCVLLATITLAPTYAIFVYLSEFHKAKNNYRRVVKALMIFIYLGANDTDKHQGALKSDYRDTMKKCDSERKSLSNSVVQAFDTGTERIEEMRRLGRQRHNSMEREELAILKVSRVAINFSAPKGIIFFRRFRAWSTTGMHNERADIEMFVSVSLVATIWSSIVLISGLVRINIDVETFWTSTPPLC